MRANKDCKPVESRLGRTGEKSTAKKVLGSEMAAKDAGSLLLIPAS